MSLSLSPRTIRWLKAADWSEDYAWALGPILDAELRRLMHAPNTAALTFLSRYGGLVWNRFNPYQPNAGTAMCHTDALTAAARSSPGWCEAGAELAGSRLCPIGEVGYGHYLVAMDEQGHVFGMDDLLAWKGFGDSGEEFLESLATDWATEETGQRITAAARRKAQPQ